MAVAESPPGDSGSQPYISKSRVKEWITCPRKFYYKYILGMRTPGTFYTKRGTRLHKTYERFHENALDAAIDGTFDPELLEQYLPGGDEVGLWIDWVEPFVTNFIAFEERRWNAAWDHVIATHGDIMDERDREDAIDAAANVWLPIDLEAEGNLDPSPVGPYWMGYADALLHAASVPDIAETEGVVIVDYKTGKTPKAQYREEGIFLEGEFYAMLFEAEYDIAAVAGYFPKNDDFLVTELSDDRREVIIDAVTQMVATTDQEAFPIEPQPLCKWRPGPENECDFYRICSSTWGTGSGPGPTYPDAPDRGTPSLPDRSPDDTYGDRWLN